MAQLRAERSYKYYACSGLTSLSSCLPPAIRSDGRKAGLGLSMIRRPRRS